jgi:hypothetical protein
MLCQEQSLPFIEGHPSAFRRLAFVWGEHSCPPPLTFLRKRLVISTNGRIPLFEAGCPVLVAQRQGGGFQIERDAGIAT